MGKCFQPGEGPRRGLQACSVSIKTDGSFVALVMRGQRNEQDLKSRNYAVAEKKCELEGRSQTFLRVLHHCGPLCFQNFLIYS